MGNVNTFNLSFYLNAFIDLSRGPRGSEAKLHERYYSLSFPNINLAF
jgi:hypothetical protein